MHKQSNYSLEQPKYQVGDVIYVVERMFAKKQLAEVTGYSKFGDTIYLVYFDLKTNKAGMIPVLFEDSLTTSAGINARLIYGE